MKQQTPKALYFYDTLIVVLVVVYTCAFLVADQEERAIVLGIIATPLTVLLSFLIHEIQAADNRTQEIVRRAVNQFDDYFAEWEKAKRLAEEDWTLIYNAVQEGTVEFLRRVGTTSEDLDAGEDLDEGEGIAERGHCALQQGFGVAEYKVKSYAEFCYYFGKMQRLLRDPLIAEHCRDYFVRQWSSDLNPITRQLIGLYLGLSHEEQVRCVGRSFCMERLIVSIRGYRPTKPGTTDPDPTAPTYHLEFGFDANRTPIGRARRETL